MLKNDLKMLSIDFIATEQSLKNVPCEILSFLMILHYGRVGRVVLRIYIALAVFQPYRDLEAGDNQSLKFKWRGVESNPDLLLRKPKA